MDPVPQSPQPIEVEVIIITFLAESVHRTERPFISATPSITGTRHNS